MSSSHHHQFVVGILGGNCSATDMDNFVWAIEQYFQGIGIIEDATVNTVVFYLTGIALLWDVECVIE